jgi:hypothetical protein
MLPWPHRSPPLWNTLARQQGDDLAAFHGPTAVHAPAGFMGRPTSPYPASLKPRAWSTQCSRSMRPESFSS